MTIEREETRGAAAAAPSGALPDPPASCPRHPVYDRACLTCRNYYREQLESERRQREGQAVDDPVSAMAPEGSGESNEGEASAELVAEVQDLLNKEFFAVAAADPRGQGHKRLFGAAETLGKYVVDGVLEEQFLRDEMATAASRAGITDAHRWINGGLKAAGVTRTSGAPHIGLRVHPDQENTRSEDFESQSAPGAHLSREDLDECTSGAPGVNLGYSYFDVAAMLDGTLPEPPVPTLCFRDDGIALFYPGQLNTVFGDPESGKTLLTDHTTAEVLRDGGRVLRLDLDHNGPRSTINRLVTFGAPVDALRDPSRFLYVEPEDRVHMGVIVAHMAEWKPTLVVLDSLGELLPMFGSNSNSADEFTACHTRVIKPLVHGGAAVIAIDHLSKGADSRAYGPGGTMAKKRVLGGTSIRVKLDVPFTPGKGGSAYLALNKDRHGGLRQHCPVGDREPLIGKFVLTQTASGVTATIKAAKEFEKNPEEAAPAEDIAALSQLDPPPKSARDVKARMRWGDARARTAFRSWEEQQGRPNLRSVE